MGRRRHAEEPENGERWLVSYADMVTLLLVFFIVLYASSQINVSKYRAIQEATAKALGAGPRDTKQVVAASHNGGNAKVGPKVVKDPGSAKTADDRLLGKLRREVAAAGLASSVSVYRDSRGIVVRFTDRVLFRPGQADVVPAGQVVVRRLAGILAGQPHPVVVEGHTDNRPIATSQFPSNWELSTARATNVLKLLLAGGVQPDRASAAGYADTRPVASNATAAGRSRNRRVELVVVTAVNATGAGPAALAAASYWAANQTPSAAQRPTTTPPPARSPAVRHH